MTIQQFYERSIKPLPMADRLRLARKILDEVPLPPDETSVPAVPLTPGGRHPADVAAEIAALAGPARDDGFSNRDHDRVLYGEKGAR